MNMNRETYRKIEDYMLSCMKGGAHDRDHVYRVLYVGLDIASTEEGVDYDILIPALLLHDVGRPEQSADPTLDHAEVGARKAYAFLTGCLQTEIGLEIDHNNPVGGKCSTEGDSLTDFPAEKARAVAECIYTHRFRSDHQPATLEARILFDADKVDVSGTIGIARTLQYSGTFGEPLCAIRPDGTPSDGSGPGEDSFMHEYSFKLEKIYGSFYTRRAAEIASSRHAAASAFHSALLSELTSTYTLGLNVLSRITGQN